MQIEAILNKYGNDLNTPLEEISEDAINIILYGSEESFKLLHSPTGNSSNYFLNFEGIVNYISAHQSESSFKKSTKLG